MSLKKAIKKQKAKQQMRKEKKKFSREPTTLIFSSLSAIQGKMAPRMSA